MEKEKTIFDLMKEQNQFKSVAQVINEYWEWKKSIKEELIFKNLYLDVFKNIGKDYHYPSSFTLTIGPKVKK